MKLSRTILQKKKMTGDCVMGIMITGTIPWAEIWAVNTAGKIVSFGGLKDDKAAKVIRIIG